MATTQLKIARRARVNVSTVNKILNKTPGPVFKKETIRRVIKAAHDLGYDFSRLKFTHSRRHPRVQVSLPIELSIYSRDGTLQQSGTAIIRDLSLSGAQLGAIMLPNQVLPMTPHYIGIRLLQEPFAGLEVRCRTVRFLASEQGFDLGVEFIGVESRALEALRKIV